MKIPSIEEAERLIEEASRLNPGPWIEHNRTAGFCARTIAEKCDGLNSDQLSSLTLKNLTISTN